MPDIQVSASVHTFMQSADQSAMKIAIGVVDPTITKNGTPVNDQVAIWTADGTVEGSPSLTFNTSTLTCANFSGNLTGNVTGNVTGSSGSCTGNSATATTVTDSAITLAKMANLAQDQFIGRVTASTGVPQTATITAAARTVIDDLTVAAMVDTLGGAISTGTGGIARATSPTFVTPNIGVATVTTVNKVTITEPATGATLRLADNSTLRTIGDTFTTTLTATGATSLTLPTSGTLATVSGALGTPSSGTLTNCTGYTWANIASKPTTLSGFGIINGQPLDSTLTAFSMLTIAANTLTIGTGVDAFLQTTFNANTFPARASTGNLGAKPVSDFGLSLIDDVSAEAARTTLGLVVLGSALGTVGTVDLDMAALDFTYQTITLTGNLTLTTSNRAAGRQIVLRLVEPNAGSRTLTFPVDWKWFGAKPANISNKTIIINLFFWGTADSDCTVAVVEEQP